MTYTISGDSLRGYSIHFTSGRDIYKCPCCDKALYTEDKARLLAENILVKAPELAQNSN